MKYLFTIIPLWVCLTATAQNPDSAQFYFKKGVTEKFQKRWLAASQAFEKCLNFNPTNTDALMQNGLVYLEMRKLDAAKACFVKVNEIDPSDKDAIKELMSLYFNFHQF